MVNNNIMKYSFDGIIYNIGINRCIDVPKKISESLGNKQYIPVILEYDEFSKQTTLMPKGNGLHRVFLNDKLRKITGVDFGDKIDVSIRKDLTKGEKSIPKEFAIALDMTQGGWEAFEKLTSRQRREFINWIESAKKNETRERRVWEAIEKLNEFISKKESNKIKLVGKE